MATTIQPELREQSQTPPAKTSRPIPPLRNGDRLTLVEFERRYDAMPHLKKAELIEGIVYIPSADFQLPEGNPPDMASPVSFRKHANPHYKLISWLGRYSEATLGVEGGDNGSTRLDLDNMPQPDAFLIVLPEYGGQAKISQDDYIVGAPELVAEVAYSSVSHDLHAKLQVYRRAGVREYVVWRVEEEKLDWFVLREGRFEPLAPGEDGLLRSEAFNGLWLDQTALLLGEMARVSQVVRLGLESAEHAAFVDRLKQAHNKT